MTGMGLSAAIAGGLFALLVALSIIADAYVKTAPARADRKLGSDAEARRHDLDLVALVVARRVALAIAAADGPIPLEHLEAIADDVVEDLEQGHLEPLGARA